ncbi:MAG: alpha-amylase family glycosyl hydrolase [Bacteroidota bacterium]|nr:alpha-amylase family glycosyl hydrolase [Bacteroidota bacterium]
MTRNYKFLLLSGIIFSIFISCTNSENKNTNNNKEKVSAELKHPEWTKNLSIYEANIRQYSEKGSFKEFEKSLPRLKKLGTDIIWLMPIYPIGEKNRKGSLGSYYAVKDYKAVNPKFGNLEDFKSLVNKAHELDMYIILDWVANHTAWDNQLIYDHPEWYTKDSTGSIIAPVPDWTDVADLNYENKAMREYMIGALKFWVKETNIDGYRCDVAGMVPTDFWENAREQLDKIKPVFMLAEANTPELHKKAFDMSYAWDLHFLLNEIAQGKKSAIDLQKHFKKEKEKFVANDYRMNFTSNHDENSWKGTAYERMGEAVKTMTVLTATVPGMPLIYSGQEACLDKQLKFFEKDLINWKDCQMDEFYSRLLTLKKKNSALWNGKFGAPMTIINTSDKEHIFAYHRANEKHKVLVILNLSNEKVNISLLDNKVNGNYTELFDENEITINTEKSFNLNAWDYKVYITK